jgi:hypothetical protein
MIGFDDVKMARWQITKNRTCNEYHVLNGTNFL